MKSPLPLVAILSVLLACGSPRQNDRPPPVPPLEAEDTLFVRVPAGSFVDCSGDTVRVEAFDLARFEVSNRLYLNLTGGRATPDPGFPDMHDYAHLNPDHPVVNVSALEAESAAASIGCRLPTPTELRYAARWGLEGDIRELYPWGRLEPAGPDWPTNLLAGDEWSGRSKDGFPYTAPVGSFPYNDLGLADLGGNVSEWTSEGDSLRTVVGGSWLSPAEEATICSRSELPATDRAWHVGFRLARSL